MNEREKKTGIELYNHAYDEILSLTDGDNELVEKVLKIMPAGIRGALEAQITLTTNQEGLLTTHKNIERLYALCIQKLSKQIYRHEEIPLIIPSLITAMNTHVMEIAKLQDRK